MNPKQRTYRVPGVIMLSLSLMATAACGDAAPSSSNEHHEVLGSSIEALGTPVTTTTLNRSDCHTACTPFVGCHQVCYYSDDSHEQSETAASIQTYSNSSVYTVAFNDNYASDGGITYTDTTRQVAAGASLMGWAYSTDEGQHWTRGHISSPPDGIAVLWGDPAITSSRARQQYVFLSNLMVPDSKFPFSQGYISGEVDDYIGGACIARSTDSGKNFAVSASDCISNNNNFYDGGSMESDSNGAIYAAFVNWDTRQIEVWSAPNETASFSPIGMPFPGQTIASHPRLKYDTIGGNLYVGALDSSGNMWLSMYTGGSSWTSPYQFANGVPIYPIIGLSDRTIRTGPQFTFGISTATPGYNDEIHGCVTQAKGGGQYGIRCSYASKSLTGDSKADAWSTMNLPGSQFNPVVAEAPYFFGLFQVWKASWTSNENDPNGNTVTIMAGSLVHDAWNPVAITGSQVPSPDKRGYWGDYDALNAAYVDSSGTPYFIRFFTDSTASFGSSTFSWEYLAGPQHVSSVIFQ
jgi:hypothetical protein